MAKTLVKYPHESRSSPVTSCVGFAFCRRWGVGVSTINTSRSEKNVRCFVQLKSMPIFVTALLFMLVQVVAAQSLNDVCDPPRDLQNVVEGKYPGTKVVSLSDLSEDDKQLFQKEHADSCPGLVKLDFYGDGAPTFALALTTKNQANPRTKLVLAHRVGASWEAAILDNADGPIPVVWSDKPGEYTGVYQRKIRATRSVIVFCGYSSWAVLYAWTNNKVSKIWLRD